MFRKKPVVPPVTVPKSELDDFAEKYGADAGSVRGRLDRLVRDTYDHRILKATMELTESRGDCNFRYDTEVIDGIYRIGHNVIRGSDDRASQEALLSFIDMVNALPRDDANTRIGIITGVAEMSYRINNKPRFDATQVRSALTLTTQVLSMYIAIGEEDTALKIANILPELADVHEIYSRFNEHLLAFQSEAKLPNLARA